MTPEYGDNAFFRDTQLPARFLVFDARMALFIFAVLVRPSLITLILFFSMLILFAWVERKGMRMENALRRARSWMVGPWRPAKGLDMVRQPVSFAWETRLPASAFQPRPAARGKRKAAESAAGRDGDAEERTPEHG